MEKILSQTAPQPFLKWAGGKDNCFRKSENIFRKCLIRIMSRLSARGRPFDLRPKKAVINDINKELINVYMVIRDHVDELIEDLKRHKNEKEYFYALRNLDRTPQYAELSPVKKHPESFI